MLRLAPFRISHGAFMPPRLKPKPRCATHRQYCPALLIDNHRLGYFPRLHCVGASRPPRHRLNRYAPKHARFREKAGALVGEQRNRLQSDATNILGSTNKNAAAHRFDARSIRLSLLIPFCDFIANITATYRTGNSCKGAAVAAAYLAT